MEGERVKKIDVDLLEKMLEPQTSARIMVESFENLNPTPKDIKKILFIFLIAFIPAFLIGYSVDTVTLFREAVEKINDVLLAIFGIVFTGYVFFQALINNELLIRMLNDKIEKYGKEKSKLQETNEEFVYLMMICLFFILLNLFLVLCFGAVPNDFVCFDERIYNNVLAIILLDLYFFFVFYIMWEIKSFIFNIFQLFKMHAGTRVIEIINEEKKKENGD